MTMARSHSVATAFAAVRRRPDWPAKAAAKRIDAPSAVLLLGRNRSSVMSLPFGPVDGPALYVHLEEGGRRGAGGYHRMAQG
jgi:hypothetical protein